MKCLHILHMNKLSGAEKLALILCQNMNRYEPIVVCGGKKLRSIFREAGIKSYSIDFKNRNILKIAREIKKIVEENNIKIIHAHDNNASINAYISKRIYMLDIKIISHIHSCYPWLKTSGIKKNIDKLFRKKYDYNIACGKTVYEYYESNSKYINNDNTTILSNAIDVDNIIRNKNSGFESVYDKYNIPKCKNIIGFVGRMVKLKGLIPFITEISNFKKEFEDSRILLIGSGELEDTIKNLIKDLELEELFILVGNQENVYQFYPIIDIMFLSSLYEGLPMVVLEAMSFGKPIVSTDVGSLNEVIDNNYNGFLVEKQNYRELIEKILYLKNNDSIKKIYGENSTEKIKENYNITTYSDKIEKIYDKLKNN